MPHQQRRKCKYCRKAALSNSEFCTECLRKVTLIRRIIELGELFRKHDNEADKPQENRQ